MCNFADDNILGDVATCLEVDTENVLKWFDSNRMVGNPDEFQVMFLGLPKNCNIETLNLMIWFWLQKMT